jgi:hypothetical protein
MTQLDTSASLLSLDRVTPLCLDRRKAKRFPSHPDTTCLITRADATAVWAVRVQNLSPGGAKLLLTEGLPGTDVQAVRLYNQSRGFQCERPVWTVYTYPCPNGIVVLGVEFAKELTEEELEELL